MNTDMGSAEINSYISTFPEHVQRRLRTLREMVRMLAPDATEKISYQMPTFYLHGSLVQFAAYPKHIGFYPTPSGITNFIEELSSYKHAKGSVQFPLDEPLPMALIERIVRFRIEENRAKKMD